jgi:BirA family transcriptional regulator, biotin operon repressor / biotin---[acetyl-CoA-carboxylase] ligase
MEPPPTDRRIDKLIDLLVRNATLVVPGPKIADEIGVTRHTVWKWIEKLRGLGVSIKGHPASGYQLQSLPDLLTPSLVRAELGDFELGGKIVHFFKTGSTNTVAARLAADQAPHGTVVVAEEQTGGRARFGRTWYSEKSSGIYVSVILRPPLTPAAAPGITLMAGLAAYEAVSTVTALRPDIRWPNDLLVNGRKICGILTEMSAEVDRLHSVVIGIGINVNHGRLPAELSDIATSLRLEGHRTYSRLHLLVAFLRELQNFYQLLLEEGTAAIAGPWSARSSFAHGKAVRVVTGRGEFLGITQGLEASGALRIRFEDGHEEALISGEVFEFKKSDVR